MVSSARAHHRNRQALPAPPARPARGVPCPALGHPLHSNHGPVAQALLDVQPSHSWPRNLARMCNHLPRLLPGDPHTPSSSKGTPQQPLPCCLQNMLLHQEGSPSSQAPQIQILSRGPESSLSRLGQTPPTNYHPFQSTEALALHPRFFSLHLRDSVPESQRHPTFSSESSQYALGKSPPPAQAPR